MADLSSFVDIEKLTVGQTCIDLNLLNDIICNQKLLKQCVIQQQQQIDEILLNGGGGGEATVPEQCAPANSPIIDTSAYTECNVSGNGEITIRGVNTSDNPATVSLSGVLEVYCDTGAGPQLIGSEPYARIFTFPVGSSIVTQQTQVDFSDYACEGIVSATFTNTTENSPNVNVIDEIYGPYCASAFCIT